ncbi:Multidrug resistance-associated protein 1 [Terramyces sp. JEL0728]|nr:Multidrug resistance-associated protein 1 [Terramyces sp. JEL0728]
MSEYRRIDEEQTIIDPNWYQFISASWVNPLMRLSKKGQLTEKDLYKLKEKDRAYKISKKLDWFWDRMSKHNQDPSVKKPSMFQALFFAVYSPFIGSMSGNMICTTLSLVEPIFLQQTILYLEGRRDLIINDGRILGLILVSIQLLISIINSFEVLTARKYRLITKSIFTSGIYQKSLRLSLGSRASYSEGKILNMINQDIDVIIMGLLAFECSFVVPGQIVFTMFMLYMLLGNSSLVAFGIVGFIGIITAVISPLIGKTYSAWIEAGDRRLAIVREMLYAIKVVKYETLEGFFKKKIGVVRNEQVKNLKWEFVYWSILEVLVISSVVIMIAVTFSVYSLLGNEMNASVIFPAILYFTKLQKPLDMISWMVSSMITGYKSMGRISEFMLAEETTLQESIKGDGSISMEKANFSWGKPDQELEFTNESTPLLSNSNGASAFKLQDVKLNIKPGTTVGVVGAVGSGKSTLLSSIIGEVRLESGLFSVNGTVAYCTQQPWILTGSIEKNILFNANKDGELLQKVVSVCGLAQDLNSLTNGLETEIGENGVNLSGGQKARVALARSIYSNADIYLLDDPLAALDAHVGKHVFKNAIQGALKDKTVLLVTHQLQYLNQLDHILVVDNGQIVESGTYTELIDKNGKFSQMIQNHTIEDPEHDHHEEEAVEVAQSKVDRVETFIEEEEQNKGNVKAQVYIDFFKAIGGQRYPTVFFMLIFGITVVQTITPLLLTAWTSSENDRDSMNYLIQYSGISGVSIVFSALIQIVCLFMCIRASCNIHDTALSALLRAPLSFFDQNPIGRILNRFSSDVEKLDRNIGYQLLMFTLNLIAIVCNIILIAISNYFVLGLFVLIGLFIYQWFILYRPSNLDLQRILSVSNSPLDAHISETLAGIAVVRAYKQETKFIDNQMNLLDKVMAITYTKQTLMVWFKFRVNMMATCVTLFVVAYAVQAENLNSAYVSIIALALTRTSSLGSMILEFMREFGYLEATVSFH